MEQVLWEKLAVNACINGVTALVGCRNGVVSESPHGRHLARILCAEVAHVMQASGLEVPSDLVEKVLHVARQTGENLSSMQQDVSCGRSTEIDYINGFVVRQGMLLQVPTPANQMIHNLIKMKEAMHTYLGKIWKLYDAVVRDNDAQLAILASETIPPPTTSTMLSISCCTSV